MVQMFSTNDCNKETNQITVSYEFDQSELNTMIAAAYNWLHTWEQKQVKMPITKEIIRKLECLAQSEAIGEE